MQFSDVLTEHGIEWQSEGHHHCRAGWIQFDCPFCGKGTRAFHMGFNTSGGYVNCWRCGSHSVAETLHELTNLPYRKISSLLEGVVREAKPERPRGRLKLPEGIGPLKAAHRRYLRDRRLDPEEIEELWDVQGIGELGGRLAWRLFIPIIYQSRTVSWTTRSISDNGLRYVAAKAEDEAIPRDELLYGWDYVRNAALVVEGPVDVWTFGPGSCCTMGLGVSRAQILKLASVPVRAICMDNQPEAQRVAQKLCRELEVFPGDTYNVVLTGKDGNSTIRSDIKRLRNEFLRT